MNLLLILLLGQSIAPAAEMNTALSTNLPIRSVGRGLFQVGAVRLNKNDRTVTFPAAVALRNETVEYAVVHTTGKTHESIFRTEARPHDLHVSLLLVGAKPVMTNSFGGDGKAIPRGHSVSLEVTWTNSGRVVRCAIEDLVLNRKTEQPLGRGEWIYNGSNFSEGSFTAQRDGSIVSIHTDPDALINNPRPGREDDELYVPNAGKLPPIGTPVEIIIRLSPAPTNAATPR